MCQALGRQKPFGGLSSWVGSPEYIRDCVVHLWHTTKRNYFHMLYSEYIPVHVSIHLQS